MVFDFRQQVRRPETLPMGAAEPEAAKAAAPPMAAAPKPVAIVAVHGMGQQVPFETIDLVHRGLRLEEERVSGAPSGEEATRPRRILHGNQQVSRLEVRLQTRDGQARDVHLYEAYWAPLTEGRVGIWDVLRFLLSGGWNGIRNASPHHARWAFGKFHPVRSQEKVRTQLALAAGVVLSLIVLHFAVLAAATNVFTGEDDNVVGFFNDLTWAVLLFFILPAALFGLVLVGAHAAKSEWRRRLFKERDPSGRPPLQSRAPGRAKVLDALAWALFWIACVLLLVVTLYTVLGGALHFVHEYPDANGETRGPSPLPDLDGYANLSILQTWQMVAIWGLLFAAAMLVRHVLVQTLGDVAAYVQTHKLDKFNDLRKEIKKSVADVLDAVYSHQQDGRPAYDSVAIVGHSLGSVVAYNALNDAINRDLLLPAAARRNILGRTRLLLTLGSPLDKIAFVFGTQRRETSWARESMAGLAQPLIWDYRFRTFEWVNLYAPRDIVAGSLELYDAKHAPEGARKVVNVVDVHATTPLLAHVEYWHNPTLWWLLRSLLFDSAKPDLGFLQGARSAAKSAAPSTHPGGAGQSFAP